MEYIVYEEEPVREQVFEGTFVLDGHMTLEQQNAKIFDMMRMAGVPYHEEDEYDIGYDGAEDAESETQTSRFGVFRTYKKKVPYRVTREEIFEGTYILDSLSLTPEQQREKIFQMMELAGVEVGNKDELEIGYDGAEDAESETQSTRFGVYRVTKTRLLSEEEQEAALKAIRAELQELREKLGETADTDEITRIAARMEELSKQMDEVMKSNSREYDVLEEALRQCDQEMKEIEDYLSEKIRLYNESFERIKEIMKTQTELAVSDEMSAEEFEKKQEEFLREKLKENDALLSLRVEIDKSIKKLAEAKKKREKAKKDLDTAKALELSASEYVEIMNHMKKRNLVQAILETKGLSEVVSIPADQRTKEQDRLLREARAEIRRELFEAKKENHDKSLSEIIEALYGIETEFQLKGRQRVLIVKPSSLENIRKNADKLPEKIVAKQEEPTYTPGDAPKDMEHVLEEEKKQEKDKPSEDVQDTSANTAEEAMQAVFTFYIDVNNFSKIYAQKYVFDRFHLEIDPTTEVRIDNMICYELDKEAARYIVSNSDNHYSPYKVRFDSVSFGKQSDRQDTPRDSEILDRLEILTDQNIPGKYFVYKRVMDRFNIDEKATIAEVDGVRVYEIDQENVDYLVNNANNHYSPYVVEFRDVKIDLTNTDTMESTDTKIRIYRFGDSIKFYVPQDVITRFHLSDKGEKVRIDGEICYAISREDADYINGNANNNYSPYTVEYKEVTQEEIDHNVVMPYQEDVSPTRDDGALDSQDGRIGPDLSDFTSITITDRFTIFRDLDNPGKLYVRKPVFDRFNITGRISPVRIDGTLCYEISEEDADFVLSNANNSYSPYSVELRDVHMGKIEQVIPFDSRISQFDENGNYKDPKNQAIPFDSRFSNFNDNGTIKDDKDKVIPFDSRFSNFNDNGTIKDDKDKVIPFDSEVSPSRRGFTDQVTMYYCQDEDTYFVRRAALQRFNVEPIGNGVRIGGELCFPIDHEDADFIIHNADNDYSPYQVRMRQIRSLRKDKQPEPVKEDPGRELPIPLPPHVSDPTPEPEPETGKDLPVPPTGHGPEPEPDTGSKVVRVDPLPPVLYGPPPVQDTKVVDLKEEEEIITLYRDLEDNNQVYAPKSVLNRFGITSSQAGVMINGVECFKISRDTDQIINSIAKMSHNPKLVIRYVDVHLKKKEAPKKPRPHVEAILDKITTGLDIRARDAKRYKASNLKIAKGFQQELSSGNLAYNIVHVVPAILKVGVNFFRKLSGKLLSSARAKDAMKEIEKRLSELSEEELEVLFEEYKGSQLKTDMNNQINPLILDRLREFGLHKVEELNDTIKENYSILFTILGQVRALEEKIADGKTSKKEVDALNTERKALLGKAAGCIRVIIDSRRTANNLLSSGVHGLEEDFKAVSTKLSYVGMRFGKSNDFDNELQHKLGNFGRDLNDALASNNDEAIVQNFMGLESCYYENTEIRGSLVGRRSVGTKYYSPIAEQFDYRDDPFIRDLLTTIAITSAAVSAVNAYRVHQIEEGQILSDNKAQADTINAQNDATMRYVHDTSKAITDKRGTFREGMEAQARQDALTNAGVRERAHLDSTNWTFNDAYHAADAAGHAAYNQFYADVTSQIQDVASQYAQGIITQTEALARMADISNQAQAALRDVVDSSLAILKPYAASHPQFDLTAFEESMEYMIANPGAIAGMNQAAIDVTNLAENLSSLQAAHMVPLTDLPSDMASTIVAAASSCLLAWNVSQAMHDKTTKKNRYGNEVTEMMGEYMSSQEEEEEREHHR